MVCLLFGLEVLTSSTLASIVFVVLFVIQVRGLQAMYQDFRSFRQGQPPATPVSPQPPATPVSPKPEPPVTSMTSDSLPDPPVVRHYRWKAPEKIFTSKCGKKYHLSPECQYLASKSGFTSYEVCKVCQEKTSK